MRTYRELFRVAECRPLFAAVTGQVAAATVGGLALASLVFARTGSPLLSALSLFGSSFAQVAGATLLLSTADRLPPRAAMAGSALAFAAATFALAVPGMPVWAMILIILATGLVNSVTGGVRWGLLSEILPEDGYILGRSMFNMSLAVTQIAGYAVGGALVAAISPRVALVAAACVDLATALVARFGLARRPARASGRPSARESLRVNRLLLADPSRRTLYLALWLPNGLIVGCEALFIPYSPRSASVLFIAATLGMLAGDALMGRFLTPPMRARLITPARLLLAAPYVVFAAAPPFPVALLAVTVASAGYSAALPLQERLIAATPADVRGQALGLHSSGMLAMQAVGASLAGAVAAYVPVPAAVALMAAASLAVTIALTPGLRRPDPVASVR